MSITLDAIIPRRWQFNRPKTRGRDAPVPIELPISCAASLLKSGIPAEVAVAQ